MKFRIRWYESHFESNVYQALLHTIARKSKIHTYPPTRITNYNEERTYIKRNVRKNNDCKIDSAVTKFTVPW